MRHVYEDFGVKKPFPLDMALMGNTTSLRGRCIIARIKLPVTPNFLPISSDFMPPR